MFVWLIVFCFAFRAEILWGDPYNEAADIFSLGVVLWEILARVVPGSDGFMARAPRTKFTLDFDAMRRCLPPDAPESFVACATECCAYEGEYRPAARDVLEWLSDLYRELCKAEDGGDGSSSSSGAGASPSHPVMSPSLVIGAGRPPLPSLRRANSAFSPQLAARTGVIEERQNEEDDEEEGEEEEEENAEPIEHDSAIATDNSERPLAGETDDGRRALDFSEAAPAEGQEASNDTFPEAER